MAVINISGQSVIIDDEDVERIRGLYLCIHLNGYARYRRRGQRNGSVTYLHSLLAGYVGVGCVDHINGNILDNRKSNLRIVTCSINQANRHKLNANNRSGIRGVCFDVNRPKTPWKATIYKDYHTINLGRFIQFDDAIAARRAAELRYFGEPCPIPKVTA